jgi:hypothetical protein
MGRMCAVLGPRSRSDIPKAFLKGCGALPSGDAKSAHEDARSDHFVLQPLQDPHIRIVSALPGRAALAQFVSNRTSLVTT